MSKIMELEFDEDVTVKEIEQEMLYYLGKGQVTMTKIKGETVYSNDPEFRNIMKRLALGVSEDDSYRFLKLEKRIADLEEVRNKAINIGKVPYFRYYYGLALRNIKRERINGFNELIFSKFDEYGFALIIASQLMNAMNMKDTVDIYSVISNIIESCKASYNGTNIQFYLDFERALYLIKEYGIKGSMVSALFFEGATDEYSNMLLSKITMLDSEKAEILGRKLK